MPDQMTSHGASAGNVSDQLDEQASSVVRTDLASDSRLTRATAHMTGAADVSDHLNVHVPGLAQSDLVSVSK
jgi:hypothetical protein